MDIARSEYYDLLNRANKRLEYASRRAKKDGPFAHVWWQVALAYVRAIDEIKKKRAMSVR